MFSLLLSWRNRLTAFLFDVGMIPIAWFGAYWIYFDLHRMPFDVLQGAVLLFFPLILFQAAAFWLFGLYRGVWRFASIPDLARIVKAIMTGILSLLMIFFFVKSTLVIPRVIPLLYSMLLCGSLTGARVLFRWLKDYRHYFADCKRILIVGAGAAGESVVRDLLRHDKHLYQPIILVDDSPRKLGRDIQGIRIAGTCDNIPTLVEYYEIDLIIIATPSATSAQMRRIVGYCEQTGIAFRTLPSINDLALGRVDIKLLRDVSLEDLLGRDQVQLDWHAIGDGLQSRTILVSGGGGSIGAELCRQIAPLCPKQLIVIDNCEYNLYSIDMELRKKFPHLSFQSLLLDITDRVGIQEVFSAYSPDMVFHAAAYKHVPLLEKQIRVAVHNNVIGTTILANAAVEYGAEKFVLISTDKAVNPTNLMGATKRIAEMICQNLNEESTTSFITVRFGNVLDSTGSVVPLFRKQIQEGGPLTVTHPEITRYFMSIPEASQLILQAAMLGKGGEIFVLDMGEPIRISYLAEQMIKLAGKTLGHDITIEYTGLRPGEKLYEELFYNNEELQTTTHDKIMLANARKADKDLLLTALEKMDHQADVRILLALLKQLVPEYKNNADDAHYHPNENLHLVASQ